MNQTQQYVIEYLQEEVKVLREQLHGKPVRFNDDQRRRLAAKAKRIRFDRMKQIANLERPHQSLDHKIITPEFENPMTAGEIQCRSRLGGLLNYYHRKSA